METSSKSYLERQDLSGSGGHEHLWKLVDRCRQELVAGDLGSPRRLKEEPSRIHDPRIDPWTGSLDLSHDSQIALPIPHDDSLVDPLDCLPGITESIIIVLENFMRQYFSMSPIRWNLLEVYYQSVCTETRLMMKSALCLYMVIIGYNRDIIGLIGSCLRGIFSINEIHKSYVPENIDI
jgi:hypothetical protein